MATPSLGIQHIAESQTEKEVTANDAFDRLDASVNAQFEIALTDADITLTQAQMANGGVLKFTGTLTANRYVNIPAIDRAFVLRNSTTGGFNLIAQVAGAPASSVSVAPGSLASLYCDSVDVIAIGGGGGGGTGGGTGGTGTQEARNVIPTGTIDGSNAVFTLPNAPSPSSSLFLEKNGRFMYDGIDFTISGSTITYDAGSIPQTGDNHKARSYFF